MVAPDTPAELDSGEQERDPSPSVTRESDEPTDLADAGYMQAALVEVVRA